LGEQRIDPALDVILLRRGSAGRDKTDEYGGDAQQACLAKNFPHRTFPFGAEFSL
jgi:hypothetical protein